MIYNNIIIVIIMIIVIMIVIIIIIIIVVIEGLIENDNCGKTYTAFTFLFMSRVVPVFLYLFGRCYLVIPIASVFYIMVLLLSRYDYYRRIGSAVPGESSSP